MAVVALALAAFLLADLLLVSTEDSRHAVLGYVLQGRSAKLATGIHFLFLFLLARLYLTHKRAAVAATLGYCGYLIATLWLWTAFHLDEIPVQPQTTIITNALITAALLAFCRFFLKQTAAFDQP